MASLPGPVAFFDGECNVCDWSVRFLLAHDRRGELHYASLQG
jgi:predicted DCC family thiol-disulfide oxidoreductase YuxK